jgi:colanic acid biosynthesis glycosyl transferase WcaI
MNPIRVWVASELYYPDEQATGVFMTKIAEGLAARGMSVKALAAHPHSGPVASHEMLNGVEVFRCWSTRFSKNNLLGRLLNVLTGNVTMLFSALRRVQRKDIVLVVTNPPTLPFVIMLACLLKGAKCIVRVDDVYPDVLHACDVYSNETIVYRVFGRLMSWLVRKADALVVLGCDMQALVASKADVDKEIRVITNWADVDEIKPDADAGRAFLEEYGLVDKLVLQWAGNMGYPHEVETLLDAMEKLADEDEVHFMYIGAGAKRPWLEEQVASKGLKNVTFIGLLPRDQQPSFLNGCDIGLSSLVAGMTGISVPSRSYNILCAGKPILAVGEPQGEVSQLLVEKDVGWVIAPGESDKIVAAVKEVLANRTGLEDMSKRARELAENEYSSSYIIDRYAEMIAEYAAAK